jgi:hypothetical protein
MLTDTQPQIGAERFRAPEILFDPEIIGLEYPGVHQIVVDAINRTDLDLRKSLYSNIVLSGGSTLTRGFGDRLLTELQRLAVKDMRIKIFAPPERKYSTWIGGSILAGLSTFRKASSAFTRHVAYMVPTTWCLMSYWRLQAGRVSAVSSQWQQGGISFVSRQVADWHADVGEHRRLAREPGHYPHKVHIVVVWLWGLPLSIVMPSGVVTD